MIMNRCDISRRDSDVPNSLIDLYSSRRSAFAQADAVFHRLEIILRLICYSLIWFLYSLANNTHTTGWIVATSHMNDGPIACSCIHGRASHGFNWSGVVCHPALYRRTYRVCSAWLLLLGQQLLYRSICPSATIESITKGNTQERKFAVVSEWPGEIRQLLRNQLLFCWRCNYNCTQVCGRVINHSSGSRYNRHNSAMIANTSNDTAIYLHFRICPSWNLDDHIVDIVGVVCMKRNVM